MNDDEEILDDEDIIADAFVQARTARAKRVELKEKMLRLFRQFGGTLQGMCKGKKMRFKPGINKAGELFVIIYLGKSNKQHQAISLDDWAEWASEYVILEEV